ncbi:CMD domain protein [Nonomuraea sp. NPDC003727]
MTDIIDQLVGVDPGSRLDVLRRRRPDARAYAQRTYEALFVPSFELRAQAAPGAAPASPSAVPVSPSAVPASSSAVQSPSATAEAAGGAPLGRGVSEVGLEEVTPAERHAVAAFVAGLHRHEAVTAHYAAALEPDLAKRIAAQAEAGRASGPYGHYREPELAHENVEGLRFRAEEVDGRLAAALEHAHLLVFRPREAGPEALERLREAGWSTTGIVTLSQLVGFLTFQIRVVTALGALA